MPYRSSLCRMGSLVREGAISPLELVDAHLGQIARSNPWLNAFVAFGAGGAAILLLLWVSSCTGGTL